MRVKQVHTPGFPTLLHGRSPTSICPHRAIQVLPVSRQSVFEIFDMRKIDEALPDSPEPPCDVIPIQDVLFVSVEPPAQTGIAEVLLLNARYPGVFTLIT